MATPASAYERTIAHERNTCQMDCQSPDRLVAADGLIAGDSEEDDEEEEDTEDDGYSE
jgi:hypothetical protein